MTRRMILGLTLVAGFLAFCASPLLADGFVVIRRPPNVPTPPIPLAVKYHHVTVRIEDPIAVTEIDQVFRNPNAMQLEGEYIFPLPEGSVVTRFSMYMNGKEVEGEILDADKARSVYESIVRRQKDPALLEYMGRRMFKARVFPIPARGETRIGLKYSEMVHSDAGLRTYRYPLNTEKFSSKPLDSVVVGVDIKTKDPLKNVYSPSHNVEVVRKGEHEAKASYEGRNITPDQDFILYYATSPDEFGLNVATFSPRREDGFFLIMLSPKVEIGRVLPKDVVFVIDTSLSMSTAPGGDMMGAAKKTLKYCVRALRPEDRFNVLDFSMEVRQLADDLLAANKGNVEEAVEYIDAMRARGATAIDDALNKALVMVKGSGDRPAMVVFLTDGRPTWGERDPKKIRENVKKANPARARVFAFGIGDDIDTLFLDRLAKDNRGAREFVTGKEDLELKVTRFFDKVSNPVLSDISVSVEGLRTMDIYPKPLPDIFRGDQLAVLGRFRGEGAHAITLSGKVGGNTHRYVYEAKFGGKTNGGEFIPRFWASLKIGHLLEEIRVRGENKELKSEIIRLSKKYGIMNNKYVSFLVVEDQPVPSAAARPGFRALRERLARDAEEEKAKGEEAEGWGDMDDRGAAGGRRAGKSIDAAKKGLKGGETVQELRHSLRKLVKYIEDRTFYFDKGVWVDSRHEAKQEIKEVKFLSDEYFKLLAENKDVGKFLALGDEVLVVVEEKAYRIKK